MYIDAFSSKPNSEDMEIRSYSSGSFPGSPVFATVTAFNTLPLLDIRIILPSELVIIEEEDQSWYWTEAWQKMERKADEDIDKGNYVTFNSMDDFIASLDN